MASRGSDSSVVDAFRGPQGSVAVDVGVLQCFGIAAALLRQDGLRLGSGHAVDDGRCEALAIAHGAIRPV